MSPENQVKLQFTFDMVAAHMLTQNRKSKSSAGYCQYRGQGGDRCGVGFCIPNHKYTPQLEGIGIGSQYEDSPARVQEVLNAVDDKYCNDRDFLSDIQEMHDLREPEVWAEGLEFIAKKYKLDGSIVATFSDITIPTPQEFVYEPAQ